MSDSKIKIGITQGDPNGIGWEVILRTLSDPRMTELCLPVIYGAAKAANFYRKGIEEVESLNLNIITSASEAHPKRVNLVEVGAGEEFRVEPGVVSAAAGKSAAQALRVAAADLKSGAIDAVVTAPFSKESMQLAEFGFVGHTEFFAHEFVAEPLMLMCSELLKVGLVTIHIPMSQVSTAITSEKIVAALQRLRQSLICDFSIHQPRIAVMSLNPHAGDGGVIGDEEREVILPAIQQAQKQNILAFGPFAADGFFASAGYAKYDALLAMYHDQGLAPFKALSCGGGVNFTAGLSVVRTSPAHGVGFDIAGGAQADPGSMREAIYLAIDVVRSRRTHARISANPLQKFKRESGVDVSVADLPDHHSAD